MNNTKKKIYFLLFSIILLITPYFALSEWKKTFYLHKDITSTIFWIGELNVTLSGKLDNRKSAWDVHWQKKFGGIDNPKYRNGYFPKNFSPKQNPFYVALPYNDFDNYGRRKTLSYIVVPWAYQKSWEQMESMCKNRWVMIIKNNKAAYAQWEDVGPFETNDYEYVFGKAQPKNNKNYCAGIDVSPAVRDYLGLKNLDSVDWRFVDDEDVSDGPWKQIITSSQVVWK